MVANKDINNITQRKDEESLQPEQHIIYTCQVNNNQNTKTKMPLYFRLYITGRKVYKCSKKLNYAQRELSVQITESYYKKLGQQ